MITYARGAVLMIHSDKCSIQYNHDALPVFRTQRLTRNVVRYLRWICTKKVRCLICQIFIS